MERAPSPPDLPPVKETVWTPGTSPNLDQALVRSPFNPSAERDRLWAAFLPSQMDERPQVLLCARHLRRDEDTPRLISYLQEVRPKGLYGYLYAADTYYQSRIFGETPPGPEGLDPTGDPVVDPVLYSSRGYLLWQFQLESLTQALGLGRSESMKLRHLVNQKRPDALRVLRDASFTEETFPSGLRMKTLLEERLLFGAVLPGQWRVARLLLGTVQLRCRWNPR